MIVLKKWGAFALLLVVWGGLAQQGWGQDLAADFDYLRLAHPEVSDFLELTDQQRTEISQKVGALAEKLAAAPPEQRDQISSSLQAELRALLTPEQAEKLAQLPDLRKLKFNFGSPEWEEVLRWFAKQADLSLVMGNPPAGAFNYTDNRDYTPAQAIDLLNSILLTKGFTLVRRDKLLILVEIKDGVPDEIIPRVAVDELEKRGTFEIVSVMFSLGDKPMEAVQAEIKPILGTYGKMAPLPNARQLLVTETVGKLRAIQMLIQSVPSPAPPPAPKEPKPAEPSVLESFVLGTLDAKVTTESLKQLAPGAVITTDINAGKLVAYGPQSQIGVIKSYMEQLSGSAPIAGITPSVQIYRLTGTVNEKQLLEQIALVAPQTKASLDAVGKRLLVYGVPEQQTQVEKLLSEMGLGNSANNNQGVRVFHLRRANPAAVMPMVGALAPQAIVTVDAATSAVVVRAESAELEMIGQLIDQLESGGEAIDAGLNIKSIPLAQAPPAEFSTTLQTVAPRTKIQWDANSKGLIVIGPAAELAQVERLVAQLQIVQSPDAPRYQWYDVTSGDVNQVLGWVQPLVPSAKLSVDTTSGRLLVFGTTADQKIVAETLPQLQADAVANPAAPLKTHSLQGVDVTTATALLKNLAPRAQITVDSSGQQLIVVGDPKTQETVASVLQQLQEGQQSARPTELKFYSLETSQSAAAQAILAQMVPAAKITWDAAQQRLSVIAAQRDQQRVVEILAEIQQTAQPVNKPQLIVYPLANELRARLQAILAAAPAEFSQVKIIDDQRPGELAVMAMSAEHALLDQIVKQLALPVEGVEAFTMVAYPTVNSDPVQLTTFLQSVYPGIKVSADPVAGRLLVWAAPKVHEQIAKSLAELNVDQNGGDNSLSLKSYRLQFVKASGVLTALQKFVPRMQLVASDDQTLIVAWGRAADHDRIKQAIAQINVPDEPKTLAVEVYPTGKLDAQQAANMLSKMFPDASMIPQVASSSLTVLARGEQHLLIRQALERFGQMSEQDGPLTVAVYRAARAGSTAAISTLAAMVPQAKLVAGTAPGQVIGLATADEHRRIQQLIDLLESDVPDLSGRKLRTYQLNPDLAAQVRPVIQQALPTLAMLGTDPSFFATWARDDEHDRLTTIIADAELQLAPDKKSYQTYRVEHLLPAQARAAIATQLPRLTFVELASDRQLTILATALDHERVTALLAEIEEVASQRGQSVVVTYPVPETSLTQLVGSLPGPLASRATIVPDNESKSLIVTAEQNVQDQLAPMIAELQQRLPKLPRPVARIYSMGGLVARDWQTIIAQLAPTAAVAVDANSGSLVVTASTSVHELLRNTMDEYRSHAGEQKTVQAYRLSRAEPTVAATALGSLVPNAKISVDATSKSLIVVASDADQAVVRTSLDQIDLNAPQRAVAQVYPTSAGDAVALATALKTLVPSGAFVADPTGKTLLVLASPDEQQVIASTIKQWTDDPGRTLMSKVYPLQRGDPQAAVTLLQKLLPGATVAMDLTTRSVAATATAEQHELIAQTVAELDQAGGGKLAKSFRLNFIDAQIVAAGLSALLPGSRVVGDRVAKTVLVIGPQTDIDLAESTIVQVDRAVSNSVVSQVYTTPQGDAAALVTALKVAVPTATLVADATGKSLLALAAAEDQQVIKSTVEQWSNDPSRALSPKVYGLERGDPAAAVTILQKLLPGATLAADLASRSVAATATADQHAVIEQTIRELDDVSQEPVSKVYPSHGLPARDWQALMLQLAPGANVAADPASRSLIVTARPQIHKMLDQLMVDFRNMVSTGKSLRTYQMAQGDPTASAEALAALLPNAKVTADKLSRTMMVVADETDQQLAAATLQEMTAQSNQLELRSYLAQEMPADAMARALQNLFKNDTQVSVVAEKDSRAIIAVATPAQHQMIDSLINSATARLNAAAEQRVLQVYTLRQGDGKTLVDSLIKLFEKEVVQPQISYDLSGKRLLAVALPDQHAIISQTLNQVVGDPKLFEVFRLQTVEVGVADSAVRGVFRDEPLGQSPSIDVDYDNQALMVRASAAQMELIREVLTRLGEPLGEPGADVQRDELLRVIPWSQDFESIRPLLNELWPQLRKNPLRVVPPERIPGSPANPMPVHQGAQYTPNQSKGFVAARAPAMPRLPAQAVSILQESASPSVVSAAELAAGQEQEPPVVLIPESDRLIIASADAAALNQLQQLLQLLAPRRGQEAGARNFQVFMLKNAGADEVATQLKQLFKELSTSRRSLTGTPVVITSDDRLNMLIVHGSRTDREVVASLLETLDSPDMPNLTLNQPVIVPVRNTEANRVLTILNSLYRTQLSSGGGRKQVAIPEGIAPEVATVLQQVNAATSGPVLTLGVDNVTNSIIVMAPQQLRDQVSGVIEQLDRAVTMEAGDQVEIIKFDSSNPQRIQKALDMLLKEKK